MSQLDRLLFNPDTDEWRNYKRRLLLWNRNLQGAIALILLIGGLSHLVLSYFRINSQIPKGIPEGYRMISLREVSILVDDMLVEDDGEVAFEQGYISVFPDWSHHRYPSGRLTFSQEGQRQSMTLYIIAEQGGYNFEFHAFRPNHIGSPQSRYFSQLEYPELPQIVDANQVFQTLQDSWGNQILLDNKHVSWPATLHVKNVSKDNEEINLEWVLCYYVGVFAPGRPVCSEPLISSGIQLASP